jgi:exopolysaccharide production protein ExoY
MHQESSLRAEDPSYLEEISDSAFEHAAINKLSVYAISRAEPLLSSAMHRAFSLQYQVVKRSFDVILSLILLVIFLPLGLLVGLLVLCTSRGPMFYRHERIGRFGVPFKIIKFRSMYTGSRKAEVLDIRQAHRCAPSGFRADKRDLDPRITPIGRIMRKLSLDELPQLFNVLLGDMSLVGPRPIVEAERPIYGRNMTFYELLQPGITGLWQVSGRSDVGYNQRISLDREYAGRWSCFLDIRILARTIPAVISMRGAY